MAALWHAPTHKRGHPPRNPLCFSRGGCASTAWMQRGTVCVAVLPGVIPRRRILYHIDSGLRDPSRTGVIAANRIGRRQPTNHGGARGGGGNHPHTRTSSLAPLHRPSHSQPVSGIRPTKKNEALRDARIDPRCGRVNATARHVPQSTRTVLRGGACSSLVGDVSHEVRTTWRPPQVPPHPAHRTARSSSLFSPDPPIILL